MACWAGGSPAERRWEFSAAEYRRGLDGLPRGMAHSGLDCVLLASELNMRYVTQFHNQIWVSPTRPRFVLVPAAGEPVAVVPGPTWRASPRAAGSMTCARGRPRARPTRA